MTYTVIARCENSGTFGIAIATYSIAVGGYCPFFSRDVAMLSTQASVNASLGPLAIDSLVAGRSPSQTLMALASSDPGFDYRQVGIIDCYGKVGVHTGSSCHNWAGHKVGKSFAVFGNVLESAATVEAMAEKFEQVKNTNLADRLILTLEAGRDAGGQASPDGVHLDERSAALSVKGADIVNDIDLRVDMHEDAVTELRRVYDGYVPYLEYYELRARTPEEAPPQYAWVKERFNK